MKQYRIKDNIKYGKFYSLMESADARVYYAGELGENGHHADRLLLFSACSITDQDGWISVKSEHAGDLITTIITPDEEFRIKYDGEDGGYFMVKIRPNRPLSCGECKLLINEIVEEVEPLTKAARE